MSDKNTEYCSYCDQYVRPNVYIKHHGENCKVIEKQKAKAEKAENFKVTYEIYLTTSLETVATFRSSPKLKEENFGRALRDVVTHDNAGYLEVRKQKL